MFCLKKRNLNKNVETTPGIKKNSTVYWIVLIPIGMFCLSFASVPIYNVFCKATGYGGTTRVDKNYDLSMVPGKKIYVRFDANLPKDLPLVFLPMYNQIETHTNQTALSFYSLENMSDKPLDLIAIYNVSPQQAGKFFNKVACFCFDKLTLDAYQKIVLPVIFYIDSEIENLNHTKDINTITLSYTFFEYLD
ncbi:MAG: cytochrome c oxidase assembly protein CtaG [Candidatus Xenolissoclinum pacificiensis L6]|uniref:Cytochrome c oxidase assembly protein CtaG n=1 Tax=Candidatus Xenolissoclinum pacificiensis L6 TaxID=1401685 RepID=W2V1Q9_9RICK|nr:MAG: cytochrome c oxidase assembly protein CtaG [Candidatus Xenolissoclinum pacificiensis L6]